MQELLTELEAQNAPAINELSTAEVREFFTDFAISEETDPEPVGTIADLERTVEQQAEKIEQL